QRKDDEGAQHDRVWLSKQAEAYEDNGEPEYQHDQKGHRDGIVGLGEKQKTGAREVGAHLDRAIFQRTLVVVLRGQPLQQLEEFFGGFVDFERTRLRIGGGMLVPDFIGDEACPASDQLADRTSLLAVLAEQGIDQDEIRGQLAQLGNLRII